MSILPHTRPVWYDTPAPRPSVDIGGWSHRIVRVLVYLLIAVNVANAAAQCGMLFLDQGRSNEIIRLFNVSNEANIPSWFNSMLLLANALLLGVIGQVHRGANSAAASGWMSLAAGFLYLSIDEAAALHENLNAPAVAMLKAMGFQAAGLLTFVWPLLAVAMLALAAAPLWRLLRRMPAWPRRRALTAGAMFLSGALGMELIGGHMFYTYGYYSKGFAIASTIEEFLEMAALIVFADALLRYIRELIEQKEFAADVR